MKDTVKKLTKIFKTLSDGNRLKILVCIAERGELCVCELQELLQISQPTISHHLHILEEVGFLKSRKEGQRVIYQLYPEDEFKKELIKILDEVLKKDEKIISLVKKAREINIKKQEVSENG